MWWEHRDYVWYVRHGKKKFFLDDPLFFESATIPRKRWQEVFGGMVVKDGVALAIWRRLDGLHQVAPTSSNPLTAAQRTHLLEATNSRFCTTDAIHR